MDNATPFCLCYSAYHSELLQFHHELHITYVTRLLNSAMGFSEYQHNFFNKTANFQVNITVKYTN